jgi:predicted DNA-binding protein
MTNKKWAVKRITVNLAAQEAERLEIYCQQTGRPATDVIRELIRGLLVNDNANNTEDRKSVTDEGINESK